MKIRDLMRMIAATVGEEAPASQLSIARGFLAVHSAPYADVVLRSLAEASELNEDLQVLQCPTDPRKYLECTPEGKPGADFVNLTDSGGAIYVCTQADTSGHHSGNWTSVSTALENAGNKLDRFAAPVAL
ncbi:hypothetical protein G6L37_01720 [Agrobacterium rubi]|nr:hypothetical protein [Agrobacterium rubi]NTF24112.1 hypothetical protein [Agrobacterium rubi]